MARPIRETPVLMGEDAIRFTEAMERVEKLTTADRQANRQALVNSCKSFMSKLTFCF